MTDTATKKTAVLLLNMGGPDSLDAVKPFLYNLFSDPDIIKLPLSFLFQKPLAWWIVNRRGKEAAENYRLMGGSSPQLPATEAQRQALMERLSAKGYPMPVYIAMRYWHPFTSDTIDTLLKEGINDLIVIPLYPHYSHTTTGSSLNELYRVLDKKAPAMPVKVVTDYHDNPQYLSAVADSMRHALENNPWHCPPEDVQVLFSAHSLPKKQTERTNDPYPHQIEACVKTVMETHFPGYKWELSFQSRVGNMAWLGPYTDGVLHFFAGKKIDNILVVPISFVSEHVETLVEIDMQFKQLATDLGITRFHRAQALGTNPLFIDCLANLVVGQTIAQDEPAPAPVEVS